MSWRVARSLLMLRVQVDQAHPNRSKASDGTIGDAAHAASVSDHNPDASGVVRALDLTHDPAHGFDAGQLAEQLRRARDPRIKYVISNRRIFSATVSPWVWRTYTGSDPHTSHVHISVVGDARADSKARWDIGSEEETVDNETIQRIAEACADAVWTEPTWREDNTPAQAQRQLGSANVNAWRAVKLLKALVKDNTELQQSIRDAVQEAVDSSVAGALDTDELARAIVRHFLAEPEGGQA